MGEKDVAEELCEICTIPDDEYNPLLDGVCRSCNPDSHEWADNEEAEQLDKELWEGQLNEM